MERTGYVEKRVDRLLEGIEAINEAVCGFQDTQSAFDTINLVAATIQDVDLAALFLRRDDGAFVVVACEGCEEELAFRGVENLVHLLPLDEIKRIAVLRTTDTGYSPISAESKTGAVVPMKLGKELIGILILESRRPDVFRVDDRILPLLAGHAAIILVGIRMALQKRRTEDDLRFSASFAELGHVVASFLHEMKNHLHTVSVTVLNLEDRIKNERDMKPAKKGYAVRRLLAIQEELTRLDNLLRHLQNSYQTRRRTHKRPVYVNEIVRGTLELLHDTLKSRGVNYKWQLDKTLDHPTHGTGNPIYADPSQIQQVLLNLIMNSVEAIRGRRARIEIRTKSRNKDAQISVSDFGTGIPKEKIRQIFEPFFTTFVC